MNILIRFLMLGILIIPLCAILWILGILSIYATITAISAWALILLFVIYKGHDKKN